MTNYKNHPSNLLNKIVSVVRDNPNTVVRRVYEEGVGYTVYVFSKEFETLEVSEFTKNCYYLGVFGEDFPVYLGFSYDDCVNTCEQIMQGVLKDLAEAESEGEDELESELHGLEENTGIKFDDIDDPKNRTIN